jgi:hypothetical protein
VSGEVLNCTSSNARIDWTVSNSSAALDAGWTLIIDSSTDGVFASGTSVTGSVTARQDVPKGSTPTMTVNVHWESGGESASFATFSATITADCD